MPRPGTIRDGRARPLQGSFRGVGVILQPGTIRDGQARPLQGSFRRVDVMPRPGTIRDGRARPLRGSFRRIDCPPRPKTTIPHRIATGLNAAESFLTIFRNQLLDSLAGRG